MLLKETMIVWTPNRGTFATSPLAGRVAVTTMPEAPHLKRHPVSVGACDLDWLEATHEGRRELLQRYFTHMIHRDHLDETHVRKVLSQISDVLVDGLSAEPPDED